jgi:hypothetical protein
MNWLAILVGNMREERFAGYALQELEGERFALTGR